MTEPRWDGNETEQQFWNRQEAEEEKERKESLSENERIEEEAEG
jgi:hypothetical protein